MEKTEIDSIQVVDPPGSETFQLACCSGELSWDRESGWATIVASFVKDAREVGMFSSVLDPARANKVDLLCRRKETAKHRRAVRLSKFRCEKIESDEFYGPGGGVDTNGGEMPDLSQERYEISGNAEIIIESEPWSDC